MENPLRQEDLYRRALSTADPEVWNPNPSNRDLYPEPLIQEAKGKFRIPLDREITVVRKKVAGVQLKQKRYITLTYTHARPTYPLDVPEGGARPKVFPSRPQEELPVVFVFNGVPGNRKFGFGMLPYLAPFMEVVLVDPLGMGDSTYIYNYGHSIEWPAPGSQATARVPDNIHEVPRRRRIPDPTIDEDGNDIGTSRGYYAGWEWENHVGYIRHMAHSLFPQRRHIFWGDDWLAGALQVLHTVKDRNHACTVLWALVSTNGYPVPQIEQFAEVADLPPENFPKLMAGKAATMLEVMLGMQEHKDRVWNQRTMRLYLWPYKFVDYNNPSNSASATNGPKFGPMLVLAQQATVLGWHQMLPRGTSVGGIEYSQARKPLFLGWGSDDQMMPHDQLEILEGLFSNCRVQTLRVQDAGHFVQLDKPAYCAEVALNFVRQVLGKEMGVPQQQTLAYPVGSLDEQTIRGPSLARFLEVESMIMGWKPFARILGMRNFLIPQMDSLIGDQPPFEQMTRRELQRYVMENRPDVRPDGEWRANVRNEELLRMARLLYEQTSAPAARFVPRPTPVPKPQRVPVSSLAGRSTDPSLNFDAMRYTELANYIDQNRPNKRDYIIPRSTDAARAMAKELARDLGRFVPYEPEPQDVSGMTYRELQKFITSNREKTGKPKTDYMAIGSIETLRKTAGKLARDLVAPRPSPVVVYEDPERPAFLESPEAPFYEEETPYASLPSAFAEETVQHPPFEGMTFRELQRFVVSNRPDPKTATSPEDRFLAKGPRDQLLLTAERLWHSMPESARRDFMSGDYFKQLAGLMNSTPQQAMAFDMTRVTSAIPQGSDVRQRLLSFAQNHPEIFQREFLSDLRTMDTERLWNLVSPYMPEFSNYTLSDAMKLIPAFY